MIDPFPKPERRDTLTSLKSNNSNMPLHIAETMKSLMEYGNQVPPTPTDLAAHPFWPGD